MDNQSENKNSTAGDGGDDYGKIIIMFIMP